VLLAIVQPELGAGTAVVVAVFLLAINLVVGTVLEPRFMGRGLDLSSLVVFLSLLFWGWVLGPVGMLLSVPLTATVKIILEAFVEGRPIARLLGSHVEPA
jgi:predicted PurR-regulated permease PerM